MACLSEGVSLGHASTRVANSRTTPSDVAQLLVTFLVTQSRERYSSRRALRRDSPHTEALLPRFLELVFG